MFNYIKSYRHIIALFIIMLLYISSYAQSPVVILNPVKLMGHTTVYAVFDGTQPVMVINLSEIVNALNGVTRSTQTDITNAQLLEIFKRTYNLVITSGIITVDNLIKNIVISSGNIVVDNQNYNVVIDSGHLIIDNQYKNITGKHMVKGVIFIDHGNLDIHSKDIVKKLLP